MMENTSCFITCYFQNILAKLSINKLVTILGIIVVMQFMQLEVESTSVLKRPDGSPADPVRMESSTAAIRYRSFEDAPGYIPPEDFIDPDSTTGETNRVAPTFDESTQKNVTTQLGQTAYLHCIVNNLGDKTVSWIRRKDFHVLTVGMDTYTSDERFQALHVHNSNDWTLQIKFTQLKDEGPYECQVSSDPKISFFVNLTVFVAKAVIEGAPDIYVKSGSSINLTCVITQSPVPPVFVFWYHDDRMINYDSSRGQITVNKAGVDTALSKLFIKDVQPSDSGNYTCCPSNAEATSITVHVLNGEKPAAMQHDANPGYSLSCPSQPHRILQWLIVLLWFILR
ncbi:neurotrimin-like [Parasteatoda tepidariorum]|uniref:neurotrimin-like n=1 Tax=Parasteatoda tepidariorum TaxID=114398 RepID=UPI00077F917B|nr:neurotrimin-like [Parasteatoda tepidariorum]